MLTSEQAFLHVVEAGSFKKAADQLAMESSSLSRKVAALEERLNIKLLHRSTSRTQPTESGQLYYEGLRQIVDEQLALEEKVTSGSTMLRGHLRIGSTVDLGDQLIVPALNAMRRQAPELSFELLLGSEFVDFAANQLDVAVRIGTMPDSSLIARRLGDIPRVLVASPAYLQEASVPTAIADLATHQFILFTQAQMKSDIEFADGAVLPASSIQSRFWANSLRAIRALVLDGAGIHWGPLWLYADDLASGRLVQVLPDQPVKGFPVYVVYRDRAFLPKKVQLFTQYLAAEMAR